MIYLELIREHFQTLGITLLDCDRLVAAKATIKFSVCLLMVGPCGLYISGAFIYSHLNDLHNATIALMEFIACVSTTGELIFFKWQQQNSGKLIGDFQKYIDNGKWSSWSIAQRNLLSHSTFRRFLMKKNMIIQSNFHGRNFCNISRIWPDKGTPIQVSCIN